MAINNNPQQPAYLIPGLPTGMGNSVLVQTDSAGLLQSLTPGTGVLTALGQNVTGSGGIALKTSPVFVTPTLGAAIGTSLALGGATLGSNALAVTGSTVISGNSAYGLASPLPWIAGYLALDWTGGSIQAGTYDEFSVYQNAYRASSGAFVYRYTGGNYAAGRLQIAGNSLYFYGAPAGAGGGGVTFSTYMVLNNAGLVCGGGGPDPFSIGGLNFTVNGSAGANFCVNAAAGNSAFVVLGVNSTRTLQIQTDGTTQLVAALGARTLGLATNSNTYLTISATGSTVLFNGALAQNATDGFLYIASYSAAAAAPTGTPTAYTGRVPMVYNTAENKLYIYNGGWKSATFA